MKKFLLSFFAIFAMVMMGTVNANAFWATADPASGSTVTSLKTIALTFNQPVMGRATPTIAKDGVVLSDNSVSCTLKYDSNFDAYNATLELATEVTAPGVYTITVPGGSFMNGSTFATISDPIELTYTIEPTSKYAFTFTPEEGTIESLSQVVISTSTGETLAVKAGSTALPVLYKGDDVAETVAASNIEASADGKSLTVKFAQTYDGATYKLVVPAGCFTINGEDNEELTVIYTVPKVFKVTADPADGSTVTSLKTIELSYNESIGGALTLELYKDGVKVTDNAIEFVHHYTSSDDVYSSTLTLTNEIKEAGTYVVKIPWYTLSIVEEGNKLYDKDITFTYTIQTTTAVDDVKAANNSFDVFNMQGMRVLSGANADAVNSLPLGVYIVNGKKVVLGK